MPPHHPSKDQHQTELERLRAENKALRQSEKRLQDLHRLLRLVADNVPDLLWAKDLEDRFLFVNQAMCRRLLGCDTPEEALGRTDMFFAQRERQTGYQHDFGELCVNSDEIIKRIQSPGRFVEEGMVRNQHLALDVNKAPLLDEDGRMVGTVGCGRDVTQERETLDALERSEENHRRIVETANEGIWAMDGDFRTTYVNARMAAMLGYQPEEMLGRRVDSFMFAEDLGDHAKKMQRRQEGRDDHYERRFRRKDGGEVWTIVSATALKNADGGLAGSFAMFTDITERKKTEAALRESEQRFRHVLEKSPVGMALVGPDGYFLEANAALCRLLGYEAAELTRLTFAQITHPDDIELSVKALKELKEGGRDIFQSEKRYLRKDGGVVWALLNVAAVTHAQGGLKYFISQIQDVTDRKRAEEALRVSEEKFSKAFKSSPVWVSVTTVAEGRFLEVNEAFTAITGYSREEALGRTSHDLGFWVHPDDREQALAIYREQGYFRNFEMPMRYKDGQVHAMLWSADAIEFADQHCFINVLIDITELRQAQQDKARLEAQLAQAQKMEAIGTLAGGIAHDFNNILGAVMGFAEIALEMAREGEDNSQEVAQILRSAERARTLVRQILTFSRKVAVEARPLGVNKAVGEALELLGRTLPKMIGIETELEPELALINADPGQIGQVILNLAGNAADAMPEGGRLFITTRNVRCDGIRCPQCQEIMTGLYVLLEVSDTGQGMPEEVMERVFDPFFTTKEVGKGTGLGLATVYGIVKGHGGHIHCTSQVGRGSTFSVFLPALEERGQAPEGERAAEEIAPGGQETILLVDDEEALLDLAARLLQGGGYQVITAGSGEQALEAYRAQADRVDLVVLDLGMPGMGGIKCLRRLLSLAPAARVLIASGYAAQDQVREALASGALGFVAKPYRKADLLGAVRRLLDALDAQDAGQAKGAH